MASISYRKPPIEQAVLEIRWQDSVKNDLLEKAVKKLSKDYPVDHNEIKIEFSVQGETAKIGQNIEGHRLHSKDGLGVVLVRPKSLTVCRFAPYYGWDAFQTEAKFTWDKIRKVIKHQKLMRLGVRYINRIDIPIPEDDTAGIIEEGDFLNVGVLSPEDTPVMKGYLVQFVIELQDSINANIRSGLVVSPLIKHVSLNLDIDVFNDRNVPQDERGMWLMFGELRNKKNALFEKYITDKSRKLFMTEND